jgi:hypothetical protein
MRSQAPILGNGIPIGLNAFGGLGKGMKQTGGTFRMTNGAYNGSQISLRHYDSNWQGGSRARITTYGMRGWGQGIGYGATGASLALGIVDIWQGVKADEGKLGVNTKQAIGRTVGGMTGAMLGAEIGAGIGVWFGGIGIVPATIIGSIIGGVVGGWGGSKAGEELILYVDF